MPRLFCKTIVAITTTILLLSVGLNSAHGQSNWQRQQQQQQQRQQDQQRFQQQQQQQRSQMQQQMQQQMRAQMQEQLRQQQRQTLVQQQKTAAQQRIQLQQQGQLGKDGKPTGMTVGNGTVRLNRNLTPSEMQRGFTGRVTSDGRALVKFQNRIFAVPASRISGLSARIATQKNKAIGGLSAQRQSANNQRVNAIASAGGGSRGGGSSPPPNRAVGAANDNLEPEFISAHHKLQYNNAKNLAQKSQEPVLILGRYPNYLSAAFFGRADSFYMSQAEWRSAEAGFRRSNPDASEEAVRNHMFDTFNKKYIDNFLGKGGRVVLASPYDDMKGKPSYSQMEIKHLESLGYVLSPDGNEMIKK